MRAFLDVLICAVLLFELLKSATAFDPKLVEYDNSNEIAGCETVLGYNEDFKCPRI